MKNWCLNNSYITSVSMFFVKNDIWITCVKDSKKNGFNKTKKTQII